MKEEIRDHVSLFANIVNSIALVTLGIFGYLVSSDVRTIQKESDQRAGAKQVQEFWNDMYLVNQAGGEKSGALGSAIGRFIISAGELLDSYQRIYRSDTKGIEKYDPTYNASLSSFISDYANVVSKTETVAIEYDYSRLKYTSLAQEFRLEAWGKFFDQTEQVRAWKEKVTKNVNSVYLTLFDGIKNHRNPDEISSKLRPIAFSIGNDLHNFSVPYLKGLSEFSAMNLEVMSTKVAK